MKPKDPHQATHGSNDARQEQAVVASRDYARQREAGVKETEAKVKKQKQKDSDK